MLIDIRERLAKVLGFNLNNENEISEVDLLINEAAKELYEERDLQNSIVEQIFYINTTKNVIALPWYVGEIRGIRDFDGDRQIDIRTKSAKYVNYSRYPAEVDTLVYEEIGSSPIQMDLQSEGALTLTLKGTDTISFTAAVACCAFWAVGLPCCS